MSHYIDIDQWPRRAQFEFFKGYDLPHFGVTAEVDVTALRAGCRASDVPFSLACWYAIGEAVNAVEALRMRLRGDRVWVHDRIRIATTVDTGPETFAFVYLPDAPHCPAFVDRASAAIEAARCAVPEHMDDRPEDDGVVHGTILPWIRFTQIDHARRLGKDDSVPRIAVGRAVEDTPGRIRMPVGISVHHALADGVHVGRFYAHLQAALDRPDWLTDPAGDCP